MAKIRYSAIVISLIGVLTMSSIPQTARADSGASDLDRPIRLHATAMRAPIGSVDAFASININGKQVSGEQSLWGGELIEASTGAPTRVQFDSIGTAALTAGTAVRFATTHSFVAQDNGPVLIASVLKGSLAVRLNQDAGAYVEACGTRFTALQGASFRIGIREGLAVLSIVRGRVDSEQTQRPNYKIRPVDELGRPVDLGRTLSVRSRSTRNFQIQVTDENDKPIPDLPILFSLGDPCLGSLGVGAAGGTQFRKNTDNKGIAAVPFIAGAAKCLGSLSAKVEGTNTEFTQQIGVQQGGFWTARNSLMVGGIVAGAAVGTALAVGSGGDSEPLRPVPPPRVTP